MKKYVKHTKNSSGNESEFVNGKWVTRYFDLRCDICGAKHAGEVCVNDLCEEEGYPDGDYCWDCQASMSEQGFVEKNTAVLFLKKDYPQCEGKIPQGLLTP